MEGIMSFDPSKYIEDLRQTAVTASLNYEIWWSYKGTDTRPRFVKIMNRYPAFFQTSLHAHFVALLVALYRLYETRKDTFNIPTFLKRLRTSNTLPISKLEEIDALYSSAKPLWQKVSVLRNNAFGHRAATYTVEEVFMLANVSANELRDLIEITKSLLNNLSKEITHSTHAFNVDVASEMERLFGDLTRGKDHP